jgi:6,7-dimethyl-8-ribityllumazine synthase
MVKSINLGNYSLRPEDYRVVVDFLKSIGCDFYINAKRFARFSAPQGTLMIRELREGQAEPVDRTPISLSLEVSSPDVVRNLAEAMQLKVLQHADAQHFAVELPGQITVGVQRSVDEKSPDIQGDFSGSGMKFAAVISRFNSFITERLLQGTFDGLLRCGVERKKIYLVRVPGAFEIPLAARKLAETKKYDAIICLGCLLRGDTAHYDVIVNEVTRGIGQSAQETGVPHAFGVLTCENLEQAIDRAGLKMGNKGFEAALAAVEMASLKGAIGLRTPGSGKTASRPQPATASKKQVPPPRLRSGLRPSGSGTTARSDKAKKTAKTKRK